MCDFEVQILFLALLGAGKKKVGVICVCKCRKIEREKVLCLEEETISLQKVLFDPQCYEKRKEKSLMQATMGRDQRSRLLLKKKRFDHLFKNGPCL